jgi:hypothetical protein
MLAARPSAARSIVELIVLSIVFSVDERASPSVRYFGLGIHMARLVLIDYLAHAC